LVVPFEDVTNCSIHQPVARDDEILSCRLPGSRSLRIQS
jgi:hypothetical protein